jgi:competence protein ComEC
MGRSVRLAVGATAAALAVERIGINHLGALVAMAMAALLVLGELGPRGRRGRLAWPIVIGAGLIVARLALVPVDAAELGAPPEGSGPWSMVVVTTGSPRDGQQVATLATVPGAVSRFQVAATLPRYPVVVPGDRVDVDGVIRPRPASPYGEYLERLGAVGTITARTLRVIPGPPDLGRRLEDLRRGAAEALARVLPEPEAGLAAGILIGLRDRVDRDLAAAFTTAGVSHVVAISGWNIAIVAAAVAALAGRLGRRRRSIVTILAIVAYVAFAGASASVVRAAVMAAVVLVARESGRAGRASAALGWAATLLLISDPRLISDAGFQLSSLATAGLIAWATPLTAWLERLGRGRVPHWLAESLGVSLAAQVATLPIVLVSFGRLAILSPLVNLVVVPLVAPAMAAGLLALAGGAMILAGLPEVVGVVLAGPGWVILRVLVSIVEIAARIPFASATLEPPFDTAAALVCVGGLGAITWLRRSWSRTRGPGSHVADPPTPVDQRGTGRGQGQPASRRAARRAATMALVASIAIAGGVVMARPAGVVRVTILDVGQGDAILIEGSRGGRLLIDGGPDPDRLLVALDRRIPPWDRRIDSIILSHPHEDHVAGLALLLERYHVRRVMEPGMRGPGPGYAAWQRELSGRDAPVRTGIAAGDRLTVDEIRLRVLWPIRDRVPAEPPDGGTGINNVSVVLVGQVGARRFLLMGDVEEAIDPQLLAAGLPRVDLLKVAHHGSRTATTQAFVDAVRPRIAVASAGTGNPYGHPTRITLERLADSGARVLRTDRDGTVVVTFETDRLTVRTEGARGAPPRPGPSASPPAAILRFRCAIPVTALIPERERRDETAKPERRDATARRAPDGQDRDGEGRTGAVGYHRADDRSWAGGGRLPPALPGSGTLVRAARARRRGDRGVACRPDRAVWHRRRSTARRVRCTPARRGQGALTKRSAARAPPRRGLRGLADPGRSPGARARGGGSPGHPAARWRGLPTMGRVRLTRGAGRGVCGQAGWAAPRVNGRALRVVAPALPSGRE